ncbi:MAG: type II toxin-antitoxin system RelE/ParE family toxin [Gemmataceae bacterium]|nr:type II toxin-antitoxin system RelE/ParE family toxin [Gemmataceae bacterium]MCI0739907.1 type II toxin-antitoxin system RelE/ParE family toxin [Gemmataceae bacterium]
MYEVRWKKPAQDQLADLWVKADSPTRKSITKATHTIDQKLGEDPTQEGESRPNDQRILFVKPLGVYFQVIEQSRKVFVLRVWLY